MCDAQPVIDAGISREIDALAARIAALHNDAVKEAERTPKRTGVSSEARKWLSDFHHMLRWADRFPPEGTQLSIRVPAMLREYRRGPKDAPALSGWIRTHLVLVRQHPTVFSNTPGLTESFLELGAQLADALVLVKRGRTRGSDAYRDAVSERDALVQILMDRVTRVRTAARFVFRNHPEIRRAAMSGFERKRRNKNRARAARRIESVQRPPLLSGAQDSQMTITTSPETVTDTSPSDG